MVSEPVRPLPRKAVAVKTVAVKTEETRVKRVPHPVVKKVEKPKILGEKPLPVVEKQKAAPAIVSRLEPRTEPDRDSLRSSSLQRLQETLAERSVRPPRSPGLAQGGSRSEPVLARANPTVEAEIQQWLRRVRQELERRKVFPEEARRKGIAGPVQVSFQVESDGRIVQAHVGKGGLPILERSTEQLLSRLRVTNPPKGWNPESRIDLVIKYQLRGK